MIVRKSSWKNTKTNWISNTKQIFLMFFEYTTAKLKKYKQTKLYLLYCKVGHHGHPRKWSASPRVRWVWIMPHGTMWEWYGDENYGKGGCEYLRARVSQCTHKWKWGKRWKYVFWESPSQCIYRMVLGFFDPMWLPMVFSDPWYFHMVFSLFRVFTPFLGFSNLF